MTGCEQKQGLLSLGSVGSGKHKHSNRKTHVAQKKINGAMHELKEYKSEGSVKTLLSAVQLSMIIQTDNINFDGDRPHSKRSNFEEEKWSLIQLNLTQADSSNIPLSFPLSRASLRRGAI